MELFQHYVLGREVLSGKRAAMAVIAALLAIFVASVIIESTHVREHEPGTGNADGEYSDSKRGDVASPGTRPGCWRTAG